MLKRLPAAIVVVSRLDGVVKGDVGNEGAS